MDITISDDGLITSIPPTQLMLTTKNNKKFIKEPDTIIIHYTAGRSGISSAQWLQNPKVEASAHVVIDEMGKIYQIVPFTNIAWHAGESAYGGRKNFNNISFGIELHNAGFLKRVGNEFMASFGAKYPANEVIEAVHRNEKTARFWHIYTEAQIAVCEELCLALMAKYSIKEILGHDEISPGRKQDPGPAFPLERFRGKLLQNNRESDTDEIPPAFTEGRVIVNKLNIREGAGPDFEKVAKPLPLNKKVIVLGERNGWLRVKVEVEGWVSKAFVSNTTS